MNIAELIQKKKEQFKDASIERRKQRAVKEANDLYRERIRQGELAKVEAIKVQNKKDVEAIKSFNARAEGPSKLQRFGQGLASVVNKGKEGVKKHQAKMEKKHPGRDRKSVV